MSNRFLERAFKVRPGEGLPTALLLVYSLFIGILVAFFFSFANAVFLASYDATMLPWAYIATGIVGYLATTALHRLEQRLRFSTLLVGNLLFLLVLISGFRFGFLATDSPVLGFLVFIWIDPVLTLVDLGFWGLAGRLYDLQQGKRLFGLISSGEVVSEIVGFFLVPVLLPFLGDTSDLLVLAAAGLGGCAVVLLFILRLFRERLREHEPLEGLSPDRPHSDQRSPNPQSSDFQSPDPQSPDPQSPDRQSQAPMPAPGLWGRVQRFLGHGYLARLSASTVVLIFVVYFLDYAFLSVTADRFPTEMALAGYLGLFWGVAESVELLFKSLLSSRLIAQFGLLFGLLALPGAVLLCMVFASGSGTFAGTGLSIFFVVISLAKLVGFVLQRSLYEPSFRVLFQPLPARQRFAAQARVEGVVRQVSLGLAGLALLVLTLVPALGLLSVVQLLVLLVLGWSAVLWWTYREYRAKLVEALSRQRVDVAPRSSRESRPLTTSLQEVVQELQQALQRARDKDVPAADASETASETASQTRFGGTQAQEVCSLSMNLLEETVPMLARDVADQLLDAEDPVLRIQAADRLQRWGSLTHRARLRRLADEDPEPRVRVIARRAADKLDSLAELEDVGEVRRRIESPDSQRRVEAAAMLAEGSPALEGCRSELLPNLFWDPDPRARQRALVAAGRIHRPDLWSRLAELLSDGLVAGAAAEGLAGLGEKILPTLDFHFRRLSGQPHVQQRILAVYRAIGRPATPHLFDKIRYPDRLVSLQALRTLHHMDYRVDESMVPLVKQTLERLIDRCAWLSAAILDVGDDEGLDAVASAAQLTRQQSVEAVLLLLSLIADRQGIALLQEHLSSNSQAARAYVLEIADLVVPSDIKDAVLPVLEQLPPQETLQRLAHRFPQARRSRLGRLQEILCLGSATVDAWSRACAIEALASLPEAEPCDELVANLFHPDPLIREVVARALLRLDPEGLAGHLERLPDAERRHLARVREPENGDFPMLLTFDKAIKLHQSPLFAGFSTESLVFLAREIAQKRYPEGATVFEQGDIGRTVYLQLSGRLRVEVEGRHVHTAKRRELLGTNALAGGWQRRATVRAETPVDLLEIGRHSILEVLADQPAGIPTLARRLLRDRETFTAFGRSFSGDLSLPGWMRPHESGETG